MFRKAFILMLIVEAVSLLSFMVEGLSLPLLIITGVVVFILSLKNLEWGVYILFGELFFGSRGHLLEFDYGPVSISLRLVIFVAVLAAWGLQILNSKSEIRNKFQILNTKFKILYLLLLSVVGYGVIIGVANGHSLSNVFNDANGYLYLLILPVVFSVIKNREQVTKLLQILGAAIVLVALKTLVLFVWFAGDFAGVATLYHWVTVQDIGEITGIVGSASRIFMQSQFYALMGVFVFGALYFTSSHGEGIFSKKVTWLVLASSYFSVIMSLSRSFWLGAVGAAVFATFTALFFLKVSPRKIFKFGLITLVIIVLEIGGAGLIAQAVGSGVSVSVSSRIGNPVEEAAGGARLLLLPKLLSGIRQAPVFGSGFGKELAYKSFLPDRVTPGNPDGEITVFAFEWGYLDTALKVGGLGLLIYLAWIANIFKKGWKLMVNSNKLIVFGFLSGLVALIVLNVTTPYLNHPLGIGYLILIASIFSVDNFELL